MTFETRSGKLGDFIELKRGYDLSSKNRLEGTVPIVSSSGPTGRHSEAKVTGPGVVTGRYGTIGEVFYVTEDFWPLNTTLYVRDFKGNDPQFIYYFLKEFDFHRFSDKAAVPGVNRNHVHEADVVMPSLNVQKSIAATLHSLDDRIDNLRATNATLEAIAQAIFKSWFIDFDPVRAKMEGREPEGMDAETAALFPSDFEESELGLIPKGWRVVPTGDLFDVGIGKTPPRKEPEWFSECPDDVPWVSIRDMGDSGMFITRTSEYLQPTAVEKFNVRVIERGTVIVSFKLTVGRVSVAGRTMTTNEAIAHYKPTGRSLPSSYLYCYLKAFDFSSLGSTSSIATATNSKAMRSLPILVPDQRLSTVFHRYADAVMQCVEKNLALTQMLTDCRDNLLPRLISGKLRIEAAQEAVEAA